ncbi:hypothetical protein [Streptomyces sp. NPDC015125]|uniref:hypothetical protein n=1 Tax=Streptomyces sp. NPDC015125 TaxID=3364938 RepID=UPI0036F9BB51
MTTDILKAIRLKPAGEGNYFVYTDRLIGRVWREPNMEWWATFYVDDGRSELGGKHETRNHAVVAVWTRAQKPQPIVPAV